MTQSPSDLKFNSLPQVKGLTLRVILYIGWPPMFSLKYSPKLGNYGEVKHQYHPRPLSLRPSIKGEFKPQPNQPHLTPLYLS